MPVGGFLELGTNGRGEVVVNHADLKPDANGVGHIVFSPKQARVFAAKLIKLSVIAESEAAKIGRFLDAEPKRGTRRRSTK